MSTSIAVPGGPRRRFTPQGSAGEITSSRDLLVWGSDRLAYIKPVTVGSTLHYGVFRANGGWIADAVSHDEAVVRAYMAGLEPVFVA